MFRKFAIIFGFFAVLGIVMPELSPLMPVNADAQQTQKKRKNLLELLFGSGLRKQRAKKKRQNANRTKKAKRVKAPSGGSPNAKRSTRKKIKRKTIAAVAAKPIVEKADDAAKILVVGDFMAAQLAQGLELQFANNPGVAIVNRSVALSGMVRDDVKSWPDDIGETIDETRPVAVVGLIGMNDRQLIHNNQGKLQKLSEPWITEYERRADLLAKSIREKRVPMIWVGLPPVSKGGMNKDYLKFNEIYRQTVTSYGGLYVDVWDGFVDTEGRYVRTGPDVNGQIVALRRADGINMTRSGYEKLAFFTEKAIKRITGFGRDALVSSLGGLADLPTITAAQYDPVGSGKTIVIALGSPSADGGTSLEGAEGFLAASDARQSSAFDLVARGMAVQPKSGRVDAGWGKPSFELGREETPEPVLANMRGYSLKSLLDELPPLASDNPPVEGNGAINKAPVSN